MRQLLEITFSGAKNSVDHLYVFVLIGIVDQIEDHIELREKTFAHFRVFPDSPLRLVLSGPWIGCGHDCSCGRATDVLIVAVSDHRSVVQHFLDCRELQIIHSLEFVDTTNG